MPSTVTHTVVLVLLWFTYFVLHSLLASLGLKRWIAVHWPALTPAYRLFFNLIALLLLVPALALTFMWQGPPLWQWTGIGAWAANLLALTAFAGFLWTLRYYDVQEFLGLRQWREGQKTLEHQEHFLLSPLHRYVRHPWYFLSLVIIWTRDMDIAFLLAALSITLYFLLGSRLEERKLLVYHGDVYRRYREQVPALIPLPWKYLSRKQAVALEEFSKHSVLTAR